VQFPTGGKAHQPPLLAFARKQRG